MEKRNEPLLLRPAGKDYLWGGKRLNDEYGKNIELSPLAETWECSTHPDGVSTVCCGTFDKMELTAVIKAHPEYLGERHKGETTLPILVKLIDARKNLSVQVHPDDDYYRADRMAFRVLLCMDGCGTISYDEGTVNFYKGDCVFVPADSEVLTIHGQAQFLDIRG